MSARLPAGAGTLQAGQVRAMFDRIAGVYDPLNTAMSAGLHHRWRARAAELANVGPGARVLDVATGTGDLALALARRVAPGGEVVGSDFSEAMLDRARAKAERAGGEAPGGEVPGGAAPGSGASAPGGGAVPEGAVRGSGASAAGGGAVRPRFEWGDAMRLPYDDDCFDAATVGFGARNFEDLRRGLAEMARVVRPGGRVVVLEITAPTRPPLSLFYSLWFDRAVPLIGRLAGALAARAGRGGAGAQAGIAAAYSYLPSSVKRFPAPRALAAEMQRAGLCEIRYVITAGGIVAIHVGTVAEAR